MSDGEDDEGKGSRPIFLPDGAAPVTAEEMEAVRAELAAAGIDVTEGDGDDGEGEGGGGVEVVEAGEDEEDDEEGEEGEELEAGPDQSRFRFPGHEAAAHAIAVHREPGGSLLFFSGGEDDVVRAWRVPPLSSPPAPPPAPPADGTPSPADAGGPTPTVVAATAPAFVGHTDTVTHLCIIPSVAHPPAVVASGGMDGAVLFWALPESTSCDGAEVGAIAAAHDLADGSGAEISCLAAPPGVADVCLAGSTSGAVACWSTADGTLLRMMAPPDRFGCAALCFLPAGVVAVGGASVRVWPTPAAPAGGRPRYPPGASVAADKSAVPRGEVFACAAAAEAAGVVVAGGASGAVYFIGIAAGGAPRLSNVRGAHDGDLDGVTGVCVPPAGSAGAGAVVGVPLAATWSLHGEERRGRVCVWDCAKRAMRVSIAVDAACPVACCFLGPSRIAAALANGSVAVWSVRGDAVCEVTGHAGAIHAIVALGDDAVATVGDDFCGRVYHPLPPPPPPPAAPAPPPASVAAPAPAGAGESA